jgi:hypothetical protein
MSRKARLRQVGCFDAKYRINSGLIEWQEQQRNYDPLMNNGPLKARYKI